ncbi:MAG: CvpA family protein [Firmicutes bacterium]|nr:CvpA family protein [Bacillota bacterium]MDH7496086.1 CvpA family protein [Bacillota bacterium]
MDWLSLLILVFVGLMGVAGLRQGLVRQVLGLAGLVAAVILAFQYYEEVGTFLLDYFVLSRAVANILGFAAICVGVGITVAIVEWIWGRLVRYTPVSWLDAAGGALFGLVKGAVLVAVAVLVLYALPVRGLREIIDSSSIAREFLEASPVIYDKIEAILPTGMPSFIHRESGSGRAPEPEGGVPKAKPGGRA